MLAEALSDRASFRRFCGFARDEATPERTAFVRFRRQLVEHGLAQSLFAAIARDLEQKGACVRKGTLIDATVIGSKRPGQSTKAARRRMAIRRILAPTKRPGSSARSRPLQPMRPMLRSRLRSFRTSQARFMPTRPMTRCRSRRQSKPKAERRSSCARAIAGAKAREAHNRPLRPIRSRVEKIFGTWKRTYQTFLSDSGLKPYKAEDGGRTFGW
jgi:transposase, IS5 family